MTDALQPLWERVEAGTPVFSADEVGRWPDEVLGRLTAAGVLRPTSDVAVVVCDACGGDHVEAVLTVDAPSGSAPRHFVPCPEAGRVEVPPWRLRRWEIDIDGLATLVARLLGAGVAVVVCPARLWLLGRMAFADGNYEVFLLRGATWPDIATVIGAAGRLTASPRPLLLVPGNPPPWSAWPQAAPRILTLPAILSWLKEAPILDRSLLATAMRKEQRSASRPLVTSIAVPPGTTWADVRLDVGEHHLTVLVAGCRQEIGFVEAGFEDRRRRGVPDRLWTLLRCLASRNGHLPFDETALDSNQRDNLKQYMSKLSERLTALLGIGQRPFTTPRKSRAYETQFRIAASEGPRFPTPADTSWDDLTIIEVQAGILEITAESRQKFVTRSTGHTGPWEGAEYQGVVRHRFDLQTLGMAGADGIPNALGALLLTIVRAGGKVCRPASDLAMSNLEEALRTFFQIDGSPFRYTPDRQLWSALFEASSVADRPNGHK